jgi:O-antigen/teichoic acid export membrane protein
MRIAAGAGFLETAMSTAKVVARNTMVLFLGRIISTGLGVVYVAALARYIQATGMGKIGTATSLVSMLNLLANLGLTEVMVRDIASDKNKASAYLPNVLALRVVLNVVFALALAGIAAFAGYPSDTIAIIYIYAIAYAIDALTDVTFSVFNAFERMEYPAAIQTARDVINIGLSLAAIQFRASLVTIVLVSALANVLKLAASLLLLRLCRVQWRPRIDMRLCRRLLVTALPFAALGILQVATNRSTPYSCPCIAQPRT